MIGILESKVITSVLDPKIYIENYEILLFDRNRYREGAASNIRSDISHKLNSFLPNEIENITFDILMSHTNPITIGIIYTHQISIIFLIFLQKIYLNSTQAIAKFTS